MIDRPPRDARAFVRFGIAWLALPAEGLEEDAESRVAEVVPIAWTKAHVERLSPLNSRLATPEATEATLEALKPILDGWSPYGPGSSGRNR
jgi:hypothetical protein